MVIDFSKIDLKEHPTLVLRNLDGTAMQTLGQAFNIKCELYYNEISKITFDIPAFVDGVDTPHYEDIVGTRIVDVLGIGQFILMNPKTVGNGIKEIKSCTAYSLEYELTYKKITLEEGTYNFWNSLESDNTVVGIILSYLPSWTIGGIDEDLVGKYRTFSVNGEKIYDFIKSTVQKTYGCIFDFDTVNRKIYVRAVSNEAKKSPVYLSYNNLAKEIEVEEDTENILTVLDVYGADGVDIRSVNPMGTNKIYNLDYYMNSSNFPQEFIDKWNDWKEKFEKCQSDYYNLTIQKTLKTSAILTEENKLFELTNTDLAVLENERANKIEYLASISKSSSDYETLQDELNAINEDINSKNAEIDVCKARIEELKKEKDGLTSTLININNETAFSNFFNEEELKILDRYFKEDAIEDSSFVITETESYIDSDWFNNISNKAFDISNGTVTEILGFENKRLFTIDAGKLRIINSNDTVEIEADIIKASFEEQSDGSFVFSGYLGYGNINSTENNMEFANGCISLTGTCTDISTDATATEETPNSYKTGTKLSFYVTTARLYFTKNTTEYEKFSVEWDLYEYGCDCLKKLAYPSYSFDVSSANFLSLEEFYEFSRKISLGNKIYLEMKEGRVLNPIFVGVSFDFDNLSSLKLQFGDTYNLSDSSFSLVDLLEQSVSMGKKFDMSRFNYNSFIDSGASTAVKEFMNSSLDVAKNAILSGSNMATSWDSSGIHCRKWKDDEHTVYEPEEIAIINNSIVFTDDNWQTAKMAIGKIIDENITKYPQTSDTTFDENKTYYYKDDKGEYQVWKGSWNSRPTLYEKDPTAYGIVAPYIVGTILAGQNLVITTEDGAFRVDSSGVHIDSMKFFITHGSSSSSSREEKNLGNYITENGYLNSSQLEGVIDAQKSTMQNGAGNVLFDGDGIWLLNAATKESSSSAIWMNERGILFGTGSVGHIDTPEDDDNAWTWTTAIRHDGIIADAMATKTLSAFTINGGSINIGEGNFCVTDSGSVTIKSGSIYSGNYEPSSGNFSTNGTKIDLSNGAITSKNFSIDDSGNLKFASGSISWGNINNKPTILDEYDVGYMVDSGIKSFADGNWTGGTFISGRTIYSPTIYANEFNVYPETELTKAGFNIYGEFEEGEYTAMLQIYYHEDIGPSVVFDSAQTGITAYWAFDNITFKSTATIDFQDANVIGLSNVNATAVFG